MSTSCVFNELDVSLRIWNWNVLIILSNQMFFTLQCDTLTNSNSLPVQIAANMKNCLTYSAFSICLQLFYFVVERMKKNGQFIVFCHCHKSAKRQNRLLIRSKLVN